MVSRMDSICERYAAGFTKTEPKILQVKRGQKQRNAPDSARKRRNWVRFGCGRGWQRLETDKNLVRKPGVRTQMNTKTMQHMKKENRRKPSVFAGFVAGAEGLGLGCRLGRRWTVATGDQRPTTRTAGGPAGAPRCQILPHTNEKVRYRTSDT